MSIFLSKLLPLFLYPTGLLALILLLALLLWKKRRLAKTLVIIALVVLFAAGNKYTAFSLARSLEWKYPALPAGQKADAIVLLGGATEPNTPPRTMVEMNSAGDRVTYAFKLWQENTAPVILLSGGNIDFLSETSSTPAANMAALLELMGVPPEALLLQDKSENTEQDALYSCQLIQEKGYKNVLLVTSAFHMPRSMLLFEAQGCRVIPAPTDYSVTEAGWQKLWHPTAEEFILNLIPQYPNLSTVTKVMKEHIGILYYRLRGIL